MQKKTEGICFAISAGICWGSMGVAAQVLMEDSGFTVGDLVAGRLLGAGVLLLMFEHFFMRRSLLKYFSQPGVAKDSGYDGRCWTSWSCSRTKRLNAKPKSWYSNYGCYKSYPGYQSW